MSSGDRTLVIFQPRPGARVRLFAFPHAGGGASAFRTWCEHLPGDVELLAVQPPGREGRFGEPPVTSMRALVDALVPAIAQRADRPFVFFGHSLGALVAYEVARLLEREWGVAPRLLCVSASRAPQLSLERRPIHGLPDREFLEEIRHLGGTPAEVLAAPELLEILLPALRADFRLSETYRPLPGGMLGCPLLAVGGRDDAWAGAGDLAAWAGTTRGAFASELFPGGHFYLQAQREPLLARVLKELQGT